MPNWGLSSSGFWKNRFDVETHPCSSAFSGDLRHIPHPCYPGVALLCTSGVKRILRPVSLPMKFTAALRPCKSNQAQRLPIELYAIVLTLSLDKGQMVHLLEDGTDQMNLSSWSLAPQ